MDTGTKLRTLCAIRDWTASELAEKLHALGVEVSEQTVGRWMKKGYLPNTEQAAALGRIFGVSVDYLVYPELESATPARTFPNPVTKITGNRRRLGGSAQDAKRKRG